MANIDQIVSELQEQRDRLELAIKALSGGSKASSPRRGRKPRKVRRLSAAARKRLSDGAKARWAKAKKEGRTSL
jgi:hypothetical protein